jgi:hypothetical protein
VSLFTVFFDCLFKITKKSQKTDLQKEAGGTMTARVMGSTSSGGGSSRGLFLSLSLMMASCAALLVFMLGAASGLAKSRFVAQGPEFEHVLWLRCGVTKASKVGLYDQLVGSWVLPSPWGVSQPGRTAAGAVRGSANQDEEARASVLLQWVASAVGLWPCGPIKRKNVRKCGRNTKKTGSLKSSTEKRGVLHE